MNSLCRSRRISTLWLSEIYEMRYAYAMIATRPRDFDVIAFLCSVPWSVVTQTSVTKAGTMLHSRAIPSSVDAQYYPSKTPGRLKDRAENAIHTTTVNGKGRELSKTPFHPTTLRTS